MDKLTVEQAEQVAKHGFLADCMANKNVMGLTQRVAEQLADTMRENERLREALEYIAGSLRNSETDETLLAIRNVCDTALEHPNKESDNG